MNFLTANREYNLPDASGTFMLNVVEDTTPQLGGTLDANGNTIDMGTNILTDTNLGQFITAYGWGDHGSAGYLTSQTSHSDVVVDGDFSSNGIMTRTGAGSYTMLTNNSSNWNTAYSWGDHGSAGYLTSETFTSLVQDTTPQLGGQLDVTGNSITNSVSVSSGSGTDYELRVEKATSDYVSLRLKNTNNFPGGGGSPYENWPTRMVFEGKNQGQVSREIGIIYASHANGTNTSAEKGAFSFSVFNGYSGAFANAATMVPCTSSNAGGIKTQGLLVGSSNSTTFPTAGNITIQSGGNITFGDGTIQTTAGGGGASTYALIQIFG